MRLRYGATCRCGTKLKSGQLAVWDVESRSMLCLECAELDVTQGSTGCRGELVDSQIAIDHRIARDLEAAKIRAAPEASGTPERLAFTLRAEATCSCGTAMIAGDLAAWDAGQQMVYCLSCLTSENPQDPPAAETIASPLATPLAAEPSAEPLPARGRHAKEEPAPPPEPALAPPIMPIDLAALGVPESDAPADPVAPPTPAVLHSLIKRPRAGIGTMRLKFLATCPCGTVIPTGELGGWHQESGTVLCLVCAQNWARPPLAEDAITDIPIDVGIPGGSAQREYERRRLIHRQKVRSQHRLFGRLILRLADEPKDLTSWATGATGERRLAKNLAELGDRTSVLHDRRVPKSRANLDHLVVGPAGVYVIDSKLYTDAAIDIRRAGKNADGWPEVAADQLRISGRDGTSLIEGMSWQVQVVRTALDTELSFCDVPIIPLLCFIEGTFPKWVPRDGYVDVAGVRVRGLYGATQLVASDGPYDHAARTALAAHLAALLPAR